MKGGRLWYGARFYAKPFQGGWMAGYRRGGMVYTSYVGYGDTCIRAYLDAFAYYLKWVF